MTDTQKRIKEYQKKLPHMKERMTAVALLLVVSISMVTSATFAWMTLSRSPEVSSIATTITTNGNLEIALSDKDGLQPDNTTVSDGGRDVTLTNLTWGNLINLSGENYGLSGITLRPASLDINNLATSPIYSTEYGEDGRIEGYIRDFSYTNYDPAVQEYVVEKIMQYGVRGISSVTYKQLGGDLFLRNQLDTIYKTYAQSCSDFKTLYSNESYMGVVYKLVQEYANISLGNDPQNIAGDMPALMLMMEDLVAVVEVLCSAYAEMANLAYYQTLTDAADYKPYTLQDVIDNKIPAKFTKNLTYYTACRTLYTNTVKAYNGFNVAAEKAEQNQEVKWSDIQTYANILARMDTATINGYTVSALKTKIKNDVLGFGIQVMGWKVVPAVINHGVLKDVDHFLTGDFYVESSEERTVTASLMGISISMTPYVYTAAYNTSNSYAVADYKITENAASGGTNLKGDPAAAETYAMAIDLWVRTNQDNALLILEGDVITETRTVLGNDGDGNTVDLYIYKYTDSNSQEVELTVYKKVEGGKGVWYIADTHQLLADKVGTVTVTNENPVLKTEEVVVGYGGVNRVWDELDDPNGAGVMLPEGAASTTQGSGSCYVFYPESPEDQEQAKKLLAAMRIAFVDADGNLLARAYLDTESVIENAGRVIVPLKLYANTAISVGDGEKTEEFYVTRLNRNEAKRVTALIYLEGTGLQNSDVLSAGSITGQLNIQFGTNIMEMEPMDHNDLMQDYYSISKIAPAGNAQNPYTFEEGEDWEVKVSMLIDGIAPSEIKANFISVINATQGARQPEFELVRNPENGYYEALVRFTAPGNYQLRSLQIDGVDYALSGENIVYVEVPGIGISSLAWGDSTTGNTKTVLTADTYYQQTIKLELGSNDGQIHAVQGVFLGDNGKNVTVNFASEDGVHYTGTGVFNNSGKYEMTYVYVDGTIVALDSSKYKVMDIKLGLTAEVRLSSPVFADGIPEEDQQRILSELMFTQGVGYSFIYTGEQPLYFDIVCIIRDDQGNTIDDQEDVMLYYGQGTTHNALTTFLEGNGKEYTGTFDFQKFGIFNFSAVSIGQANFITRTSSAHGITAIPADPMEYVGNDLPDSGLVFDLGGERNISVELANASAAKMKLILVNEEGKQHVMILENPSSSRDKLDGLDTVEVSVFTFQLPSDGDWTIAGAQAGIVFYDNVFYSGVEDDENTWLDLMPLMQAAGSNMSAKFVTTAQAELVVEGATDNVFDLGTGKIGDTFTMDSGKKMKIVFRAYDGKNIAEYASEAGVTLTAQATGSYIWNKNTVTAINGTPDPVVIGGSANLGAQNAELVLSVGDFTADGNWKLMDKLTVTLNRVEYTVTGLPGVKVTWEKPTVTVTGVTPAPGTVKRVYTVKTPTSTAQAIQGDFFSYSDFKATVYIHTPAQGGGYDQEAAEAYAPEVTLKLTGVPSGITAKMVFNTSHSDSVGSTFNFTGETATAAVGKAVNGTRGWFGVDDYPECYPAGTMTQNKISLTYGTVTYEVTLTDTVTIDQPQSPSALIFAGIPETYTGTRPSQVIGEGSMVTVTLPELSWTATVEKPKDGTWSAYTAVGEVPEVNGQKTRVLAYTTWTKSGTCSSTTYYTYQYFVWTKFESSITAATDIYQQDKTITKWIINGRTYNAGQEVTVSGEGIITATAVVTDVGAERFVETKTQTTYKYLYGYVAEAKVTETETAPDMASYHNITTGTTQNETLAQPKLANIANANAATDTPGTNTTTDSSGYTNYWNP